MVNAIATTKKRHQEKNDRPSQDQVAQMACDIVTWIREPFERLVCAFDMFKKGMRKIQFDKYLTPGEFVELILSGDNCIYGEPVDHHWIPQTKLHTYQGRFLPTKVHAFDDLNETWPLEFPKIKLWHLNSSIKRMTVAEFMDHLSPGLVDQLEAYYASDTTLYSELKANA